MNKPVTVLVLENTESRWQDLTDRIRCLPGKYLYIASESEKPDMVQIRRMLSGVSGAADLIVPVPHTLYPVDEPLEEKAVHSIFYIHERYERAPLLNGRLIRKNFLLKCLNDNLHDWIHAPCPDLFLLCFALGRAVAVRSDYSYEPESFAAFCRMYRSASVWLENRTELSQEDKYALQAKVLQYGTYLIHLLEEMKLPGFQSVEWFEPELMVHACFDKCPEKLSGIHLPRREVRPTPIHRLAVFCWALRQGGGERCTSLLLKYFSSLPNLKICLFLSKKPEPEDYPCPENVEIIVIPYRFYNRQVCLSGLLQEKMIDTCLFTDHSLANTYYDILSAWKLGIRTIAMEHSTFSYPLRSPDMDSMKLMMLRRLVYSHTDIVTCLSRYDEFIWKGQGINARYMPNPLTSDSAARPPFTERENKNLIFIARMIPGKGVLDAVRTAEEVRKKHPDVKLFMLGSFTDPEFERGIRNYVHLHQLDKSVEFTGFTTEVEKYISRSSIHLMPSSVEGYPMTLMEAKSYGLPTVAYSLPYLEAGKEEYGTIMVPQGDYLAMAEKVSELLDDFGKLNGLARKTYASLALFDNRMVFSRWKALFQWLENGTEPDELKLPRYSDLEKLRLQQMMTDEIIAAVSEMDVAAKFFKKEIDFERRNNILFDYVMKVYSALHRKISGNTRGAGFVKKVFSLVWLLKRCYRVFKPWKDQEQEL